MRISLLNLPASVVKTVRGKRYMLNGTLLSINESANTCKVQLGNIVRNVPLDNVYLNEGLLDTIKDFGKSAWEKIKGVVKLAKGFIVPVDESGKKLFEFFNIPVNLLGMKLKPCIKIVPANETFNQATSNGLKVVNNETIDSAFEAALIREADEANKYWAQVMKEYAKNEDLNISQTIKLVNEKYYRQVKPSGALNEAALDTMKSKGNLYGVEMGTTELKDRLIKNVYAQIEAKNGATSIIVWGAPGIGKSAIISLIAKDIKAMGKYDLNTIVIQSGALHSDDFTLPGTTKNIAGLTVAEDIAKTWLPVYSKSLKEHLPFEDWQRIDDLYNSGRYGLVYNLPDDLGGSKKEDGSVAFKNKRGEELASFLPTKVDKNGNIYKTGGILFFDEIARMADKQTQTVVMNLVADRKYGTDMILASRWAILAAANRRSDDALPEFEKIGDGIDALRTPAVTSRYLSITYRPSLKDWLTWARSPRSETDDRQNILEIFCEFVERMGEKAIYDCIDCGGHAGTRQEIDKIGKVTAGVVNVDETDKKTKDDFMADAIEDLEEYQDEHNKFRNAQLNTFNYRSMERNISNYVELELKMLFDNVPGGFDKCWGPITHIDSKGKEHTTKTIKKSLLKQQLKEVDKQTWMDWCEVHAIDHTEGGGEQWSGWKSDARGDRYAFIMKWLSYNVFPTVAGAGSVQAQLWKSWNEYGKTMSTEAIQSIWQNGYIAPSDTELGALDLLAFMNPNTYMQFEPVSWKLSTEYVKHVIKDLLSTEYFYDAEENDYGTDCFNDKLAEEIQNIAKMMQDNGNQVPTMPKDIIEKWRDHFTYTLYTLNDGEVTPVLDKEHAYATYTPIMRETRGLLNDKEKLAKQNESNNKLAFILENSTVAQQLSNVGKYFHQVAKQTNTSSINNTNDMVEEFFNFAITNDMTDTNSKYAKDRALQEAIKYLNSNNIAIQGPALTIIKNIGRS